LVDPKLFDFAGLMRDPDKFELNSDDIPDLR
jgi:tRNA 2-thiocytidine biosynthesis protein TtcA